MKNSRYCVAVMSIGSGVGQSVIRSCNLSNLPLTTVGMGINPFAFGAYECDVMEDVPSIYTEDYIERLVDKCKLHSVDIIIPGLDDEALILSENRERLENEGLKVIVSEAELVRLTRNKDKMSDVLSSAADIFVKSYDPQELRTLLSIGEVAFPLIAKPRGGAASRDIMILLEESDLNGVTSGHIVQELAIPQQNDPYRTTYMNLISRKINPQLSEISIQVVNDKDGKILGRMASYNKLNNGVPIEILPYENDIVWNEIDKLLPVLRDMGHRGPLNIQGRLTDNGLKIFEMNARFTGITGLRALMGFNEVERCIRSWLDIDSKEAPLAINPNRFGTRQFNDKAISFQKSKEIFELSRKISPGQFKLQKNILITGATGYLGQALARTLIDNNYSIMALCRDRDKAKSLYKDCKDIKIYDEADFNDGSLQLGLADCIIHCGFARPHRSEQEIAESLRFTGRLFGAAAQNQVPVVINISSQSIYGTKQSPLWNESTPASPETVYAQAKYATELVLQNVKLISKHSSCTSLRLASLAGGQSGLVAVDILTKFVENALNSKSIEIVDGSQRIERLDVRDAASGILSLLKTDPEKWEPVYNFGANRQYTVLDLADSVTKMAREHYERDVTTLVKPGLVNLKMGMDSSSFYELTGWQPHFSLEDMVLSLFEYFKENSHHEPQHK